MRPSVRNVSITIENKTIGHDNPCFIIAEAGVNHNGELAVARQLIDAAFKAGADAIKFQTFKTENLVTPSAKKADYQKKNDPATITQYQMLKKIELSEDDFRELSVYAKKKPLIFLSTAFDDESVDLLVRLEVPAFKIPSGEITNFPLLKKIARHNKPVILSTGMSTLEEVREAVTCLQDHNCRKIVLLHCTTSYPASPESVNLRSMDTLSEVFHLPVGYSDHTEGVIIPIAAVARGACIVEKHITLDRNLQGPDHAASMEPDELKMMISAIRMVERSLGDPEKKPAHCEINNRDIVRRSVVASQDIPAGSVLLKTMLALKRPGTGIGPKYLEGLVGKRVKKIIKKDTVISWDMIE